MTSNPPLSNSLHKRKRRRLQELSLSLDPPNPVASYFFNEPHINWSLEGFCQDAFNSDHRQTGDDICHIFYESVNFIRDSESVPRPLKRAASTLATLKQSHVKRIWQQSLTKQIAEAAAERLRIRQEAKDNFIRAAELEVQLCNQLEGNRSNALGEPDILDEEDQERDGASLRFENASSDSELNPSQDEDTTGNSLVISEKPSVAWNWTTGPGDSSSNLETKFLWIEDGVNISQLLANRRARAMLALEKTTEPDVLALRNFIYTPEIVKEILSIEQWESATAMWYLRYQHKVTSDEVTGVVKVSLGLQPRKTFQEAVIIARTLDVSQPLSSIIIKYHRTAVLWDQDSFYLTPEVKHGSEDSFINDFVKPVIDGTFGDLLHCTPYWIQDEIQCGKGYNNEEKLCPVFFLATRNCAIAVMEVISPFGPKRRHKDGKGKLFDEMKLSVDGLLHNGVDASVVGLLVTGMRVDLFAMSLDYEACYLVVDLGSFDLVGSRFQFSNLLIAAQPLLTARGIVLETMGKFDTTNEEPVKSEWVRGTYYTKPIKLEDA
ncbi:hypothetical protein BGZ79_009314 [Entomortierella chlamydospora]|nr:hypothetical protein BGZ79_009314 [Entomortierella chlamydospora]